MTYGRDTFIVLLLPTTPLRPTLSYSSFVNQRFYFRSSSSVLFLRSTLSLQGLSFQISFRVYVFRPERLPSSPVTPTVPPHPDPIMTRRLLFHTFRSGDVRGTVEMDGESRDDQRLNQVSSGERGTESTGTRRDGPWEMCYVVVGEGSEPRSGDFPVGSRTPVTHKTLP